MNNQGMSVEEARKQCILIIDDEPLNIRVLSKILLPEFDVRVARTGTDGLIKAVEFRPDLILLDIIMEDMDGFEVLEQLQSLDETQKIPTIFITSCESQEDEEKGLSLGAVDYIRKPFVEKIVKLRVETHLKLQSQMRIIERFGLVDALTELNNRRSFDQQFEFEWSRARRDRASIALLMIDIDKFKVFNDTYGHASGDLVLKAVANTMKLSVKRGTDHCYRLGGEEFVIFLPDTELEGALVVAELVRSNVEKLRITCVDGSSVNVTISIGVGTIVPKTTDSPKEFMHNVDGALYSAKHNGRNRVESMK